MDDRVVDFIVAAAMGGLGKTLLDWVLNRGKYGAEVQKTVEETNKTTSAEWKSLYSEVKTLLHEQEIKIDKLEIKCEELRLENVSLQHQISFGKAIGA